MRLLFALLLPALCAACAVVPTPLKTYEGPQLPSSAQALISGPLGPPSGLMSLPYDGILIVCLDGVTFQHLQGYGPGVKYPDKVFVKPGRHYLKTMYFRNKIYAYGSLWVDAEAGREYALRSEVKAYAVRIWLEDTITRAVVGGIPGGEPNPEPNAKQC